MFGFIYYGIVAASKAITAGKYFVKDTISKTKAISNDSVGYWDHKGLYYDTKTNKPIYHDTLKNGDRVIKTWDGKIVKNITGEDRAKRIAQINNNNHEELILLGRGIDVLPSLKIECLDAKIPRNACVYKDSNEKKYIKVSTSGSCTKKAYVNLSNGEYVMFGDINPQEQKWLDMNNINFNEGKQNHLRPTTTIECMY